MHVFCISQGTVTTFFRCGGQVHDNYAITADVIVHGKFLSHLCQVSSGFWVLKSLKSINFYRVSYALAVYAMVVCLSVCLCVSVHHKSEFY